MKVYFSVEEFGKVDFPVLTTGTFDGVHVGHKKIIANLTEIAEKKKGETVLLTFSPHPRLVLQPEDNDLQLLSSQQEKIDLLDKAGIDHLIIHPFTKEFSRLSSIDFIRNIVVNGIGTKKLVIGYNHHFGRNREGTFENLQECGPLYGFDVEEIPAQDVDEVNVSSTKIRNALKEGNIDVANKYLGYNYFMSGKVVAGNQIGRTLGYPTANLKVENDRKLIPANGVYAVSVWLNREEKQGMLSIGNRPTIENENKEKTIEVNIFDFNADIYNTELTVVFHKKLREEKKFDSIEELKSQLELDKNKSLQILMQ